MTDQAVEFEQRITRFQRPGDGGYLLSHWDGYTAKRYREICGLVAAVAAAGPQLKPNEKKKIQVAEYGSSSGALFRALEYYLGHKYQFDFVAIDTDRRALGFLRGKFPNAAVYEADPIRLSELVQEVPIKADIGLVMSTFYAYGEDDTRLVVDAMARIAPVLIVADQIENFAGASGGVLSLQDYTERPYDSVCHPFQRLFVHAGYSVCEALPTAEPFKSISGFVAGSKNSLPERAILEKSVRDASSDEFTEAAEKRNAKPISVGGAPRVNSVSFSIGDALDDVASRGFKNVVVYGDNEFFREFVEALDEAVPGARAVWVSSAFSEIGQGAKTLDRDVLTSSECVVVGGALVNFYHPRLLRTMGRFDMVRPVFAVAQNWEFCLGQISYPDRLERAQTYLFNHFLEYFGIRDPILARVEVYDQRNKSEKWILFQPGESVQIDVDAYLPHRAGPVVVAVYTTAPVLTRGRHFRWRFCADAEWGGSIATLHGAHDIQHASAGTEFIQSRTSFGDGQIVFTLPNHYDDMSDQGVAVECLDGERRFEIRRDRTHRIEQVELPLHNGKEPEFGDYIGCKFRQYTTPYWFSFEERHNRKVLSANHIQGQSFEFLTKEPPTHPLGELEHALLGLDIVTWPYCVPVLPEQSGLEIGCSFDSSWPVLRQFVLRFYDRDGHMLSRMNWMKDRPGLTFADELVAAQNSIPKDQIAMVLLNPDWKGMNLDQQKNGISPIVDLALRHRESGDYDITEFQNSWRNLGVLVEKMPHWIHPSNHLLGGTNLYGRALARKGWRTGALLVNGSGNLRHDVEIDYVVKLFDRDGNVHEADGVLKPFTSRLAWLDELFPDLEARLGDEGYGAMVIRSRSGDLNGQIVTVKDNRAVSLQHMWGY